MDNDDSNIPFLVEVDTKGGTGVAKNLVPVEDLKRNLENAAQKLAHVFEDIKQVGEFNLTEVSLGLEVGAGIGQ